MGTSVSLCRSSQPLPEPGQLVTCDGCGRMCSRLMRLQCERKGPAQGKPVATDDANDSTSSAIGERLAGWFSFLSVKSGCGCSNERDRLNRMTTAEARSKAGEIARNMLGRVDKLTGIGGRLIQWAAFLFPAMTLLGLRVLIRVVIFQEDCAGFLRPAKAR